ncbi:MAG: hypothetical protein ACOYEF_11655 [Planifilum sp.]|jgi:hypothetical protein
MRKSKWKHAAIGLVFFAVLSVLPGPGPLPHASASPAYPKEIDGGAWPTRHVQGIAVDPIRKHLYFSFTQILVKTDFQGRVLGTVEGIAGHLGDIDWNPKDGRIYGSLEYKDAESFYIAVFDGNNINRVGMDAEADGVMSAVYLREVVEDYTADMDGNGVFDGDTADTPDHRYGCSGIDGVSFGPAFGRKGGPLKLMVAYGIYANPQRDDNDHQIILQYDISDWKKYEKPLSQDRLHKSGPKRPENKYFVYTGNTTYGVQNLEYDAYTGNWFLAVYEGEKERFPNYSLFIIDGSKPPRKGWIRGQAKPEKGWLLPLLKKGLYDEGTGIYGWEFSGLPRPTTAPQYGIESLGNGYYYITRAATVQEDGASRETATALLHRWTGQPPTPFVKVR